MGQPAVSAQTTTGIIEGRVFDAVSGSYLRNAVIAVEGTDLQTLTNIDGEFLLANVPAGPVRLRASYPGYESQAVLVEVNSGRTVRQDLTFRGGAGRTAEGQVLRMEAFTVEEQQLSARSAALLAQRTADNIKNVVSLEELGDLGVSTAGHFLAYVPGIATVNSTGEIEQVLVRGMPPSGTLVLIDGAEAASNDPNSRAFNFAGSANTNNLDRIEVTKVPTPDLPANAVGGSINLIEKSARHRRTPLFRYNVFATFMAEDRAGRITGFEDGAGMDGKTDISPVQPAFDVQYLYPINESLALNFTAGRNARLQDREYTSVTWNRVAMLQTNGTFNSVLNVFNQDTASVNLDARLGRGTLRAAVSYTGFEANVRQRNFQHAFGTGATGGEDYTQGAPAGVGSVTMTGGDINQSRSMINSRLSYRYEGARGQFDAAATRSETSRAYRNFDDGMFQSFSASIPNLVLGATGFAGIHRNALPRFTALTRTGAPVDIHDVRQYALNSVASTQNDFKNVLSTLSFSARRSFEALPLSVRAGGSINEMRRDSRQDIRSWTFNPPDAATGGRLIGNYDLVAAEYSARREFHDDVKFQFLNTSKLFRLYQANPDQFVLNERSRYTNLVNNSKNLAETITSGFVRGDLRLLSSRLWLVGGVRFEHTADMGEGPLRDVNAAYQRDAAGNLRRDANGRLVPITTDPAERERLEYRERGIRAERSYQDYYPSFNASYTLSDGFVARFGYARTIGRPDLSFIIPGTTIADPDASDQNRIVTVVNGGLQPWAADNFDLSLEMYETKGATVSIGTFRKDVTDFFVQVRTAATPELLARYDLPDDLLNYDIVTRTNSAEAATINGFEWSWRQSLRGFAVVPGWLKGVQLYANGTHLRLSGPGRENFAGYTPKVINWGVAYLLPKFVARFNITNSGGTRSGLLAPTATVPAGSYTGQASRTILSASFQYRFYKRMSLQLNAQNLTNSLYRSMTYSPGAPAYTQPTQFRDLGVEYTLGVRGEF